MLLLVVQAQHDEGCHLRELRRVRLLQQRCHVRIHVGSVLIDLCYRWPGQQTAIGAAVPLARTDVIRIEQITVGSVVHGIAHNGFGSSV